MIQQQCFLLLENKKKCSKLIFRFINCNRIIYTIENQKILILLNEVSDSKFITRKWNISNGKSNARYDLGNEVIYNTEVLESNLCYYNETKLKLKKV